MKCKYSLKINGKTVTLLSDVSENIKDINDLERLLRIQSPEILSEIKEALKSVNVIEELDLTNIDENSVGLYSPSDLINSIVDKNKNNDARLLRQLKIGKIDLTRNLVIAGFGKENVPTQYKDDHVFLNLNYLYDSDNKIIALAELALHTAYPDKDTYKEMSEKLRNLSSESNDIIKSIIKSNKESEIVSLTNMIKGAYDRARIKLSSDIGDTNISVDRQNLESVYNRYSNLATNDKRDLNYRPKSRVSVENLKQGDLVLIPLDPQDSSNVYKTGVYEIFYDSYVDINGQTIIRTVVGTDGIKTRNRIASIYGKNGEKTTINISNVVEARIQDSEEFSDYKYKDDEVYETVDTKFFKGVKNAGMMYHSSLLEVLKNPGVKVKIGEESHKISKLQGSTVTTASGNTIDVTKISKVEYPTSNIPLDNKVSFEEAIPDKGWSPYMERDSDERGVVIGEKIAFKKSKDSKNLTVGVVIGSGIKNNEPVVFYTSNSTEKGKTVVTYIKESNIRFISNPPMEYHLSTIEQNNVESMFNKLFLQPGNKTLENIAQIIASNKKGEFRDLPYSVQELNRNSQILPKDILYNKKLRKHFKVISSNNNYVKVAHVLGNVNVSMYISKDDLGDYLMFTERPINESFAWASIWKNRYNLYNDKRDNSTQVKVYKKANGFVYTLPANLSLDQIRDSKLYDSGDIDITDQMKIELKNRYKWSSIPENLYTYDGDFEGSNKPLKNTNNTIHIPFTNSQLSALMSGSDYLQKYILPGSFVTFEGNAKAYVVEKVYKDSLLLSYYHYTDSKNDRIKNNDLKYIKSEKFFLTPEILNSGTLKVTGIRIPAWASEAKKMLSAIQISPTNHVKQSKVMTYSKSDSPEIVMEMANLIKNKYGVNVNIVHNNEISQFGDPELYEAAAFVTNGEIYINIDKASIEEPLHELLHLVLATMKANNSTTYYKLVNSVQYHPLFKLVSKNYNEINTELLEETFVKLLSQTFRKNILKDGVFNESSFNFAIRESIKDLMDLTEDLNWEDPFNLLGTPINQILSDFGSKLVDNEESLINEDDVNYMFGVSSKIKSLIEDGSLIQKCKF